MIELTIYALEKDTHVSHAVTFQVPKEEMLQLGFKDIVARYCEPAVVVIQNKFKKHETASRS